MENPWLSLKSFIFINCLMSGIFPKIYSSEYESSAFFGIEKIISESANIPQTRHSPGFCGLIFPQGQFFNSTFGDIRFFFNYFWCCYALTLVFILSQLISSSASIHSLRDHSQASVSFSYKRRSVWAEMAKSWEFPFRFAKFPGIVGMGTGSPTRFHSHVHLWAWGHFCCTYF